MLNIIWETLRNWFGVVNTNQRSKHTLLNQAQPTLTTESVRQSVELTQGQALAPKDPPKLYSLAPFVIEDKHITAAEKLLFTGEREQRRGPTKSQEKVIYSTSRAISVLAGAGSGKSTTLVSRILFLHKILGIKFETMAVFTFTRKSRTDFIEKLLKEAQRWEVLLTPKRAEQLVRTFHSKALQIGSSLLGSDKKIFEFLDNTKNSTAPQNQTERTVDNPLSVDEEKANEIEGYVDLEESPEQNAILKEVYAQCYNLSSEFRKAIYKLYMHTILTPPFDADERYKKKLTYIKKISARDTFLCDYMEATWQQQGLWPIPGVIPRGQAGTDFSLDVMGMPFSANGYISSLKVFVVLGPHEEMPATEITLGNQQIKLEYAVADRRTILLAGCDQPIRYIKNKRDAEELRQQLVLATNEQGLSAPALEIKLPGEYSAKPVFSSLYTFGMFAENLGLDPITLPSKISSYTLNDFEKSALIAVSLFYKAFYKTLEDKNFVTFNQLFAKLGEGNPELAQTGYSSLLGIQHLLIDEFQDISPLIVKFIRGLHSELVKKSGGELNPSLMCVGDDWQSIYGWRGSSPHFLLNTFSKDFPGASNTHILLEENFRSSQNIINCGEAFITKVIMRSAKKGIASNPSVKDLSHKTITVEKYEINEVTNVLKELMQLADEAETIYLLAATHEDLNQFKAVTGKNLMKTTFHQSKGLEADYVVLVGATSVFGSNKLKNHLYSLAQFPQSFDVAKSDEALRVAYVATTRAKKFCIWFAKSSPQNVIGQVPADGKTHQLMKAKDVSKHLQSIFKPITHRKTAPSTHEPA